MFWRKTPHTDEDNPHEEAKIEHRENVLGLRPWVWTRTYLLTSSFTYVDSKETLQLGTCVKWRRNRKGNAPRRGAYDIADQLEGRIVHYLLTKHWDALFTMRKCSCGCVEDKRLPIISLACLRCLRCNTFKVYILSSKKARRKKINTSCKVAYQCILFFGIMICYY